MERCKLHVTGASGSGTTTLARAVADHWAVPHADADDYFWVPSDPPYVEKRAEADRTALMREVFVAREAWVLSGTLLSWGQDVIAECDAVVFLTLAPEERIRRLELREERRRAGRPFDTAAWEEFLGWARGYDDPAFEGRTRVTQEQWLAALEQPVLRLDSAASHDELLQAVLDWDPSA
jgi:adenylate kinase family enzyme